MLYAITGTTGKIGGAVLNSILTHNLIPPSSLVICTSSDPSATRWEDLKSKGAQIRQSNYNDPSSMKKAFSGCTKLFLVSTPEISLDYGNAVPGRERHHINAIKSAREAGVKHIFYTSLAFGDESRAGVMRAHLRTEEFLETLKPEIKVTVIREGLYNESWPLYFGFYFGLKREEREEVVVAGDGGICWTSIGDLGLVNAVIFSDEDERKWAGKKLYLSQKRAVTLREVAKVVSEVRGREVKLKVVGKEEFIDYYVGMGRDKGNVEWWVSSYDAVKEGECVIDDETLEVEMGKRGIKPKQIEETIREMLA